MWVMKGRMIQMRRLGIKVAKVFLSVGLRDYFGGVWFFMNLQI